MPKKTKSILGNQRQSCAGMASQGARLCLLVLTGVLAVVSITKPYAAARILPWFLWAILALLAFYMLWAGWKNPRHRRVRWSGAVLAAVSCPVLAWCIRADQLAGAGAGVGCFVLALIFGKEAWSHKKEWFTRSSEFLLFLLYGGAGVLAFLVFSRHYEAAARRFGILFAAAALEILAQTIEGFSRRRGTKKC